jgi:type I restriction enzyme S subunit
MRKDRVYPPSVQPGKPKIASIPSGWKKTTYGDVLATVSRPAMIGDDERYRLVNAKRNRGGIVLRDTLPGRAIKTKSQFFIRAGDFLVSRRQIVHGACGVVPSELDGAIVSNEYAVFQPKNGLSLDFFRYFTHTIYFQQTCFHASVGVAVEKLIFQLERWLAFPVVLPPPAEQRHIAAILSTWDEAIRLTETEIAAKQDRKEYMARCLLTGKVRFPQYKSQPWKETLLGRIGTFSKGAGIAKSDVIAEGYPAIRYGELYTVHHTVIRKIYSHVSESTVAQSRKITSGDILFAGSGETAEDIGKPAVYLSEAQAFAGGDILILSPYEGDPLFLAYALNARAARRYRSTRAQGQSVVHIYRADLEEHPCPFPSLEEQRAIAHFLEDLEQDILLAERRRKLLIKQRKGLMQQLLTGKVRVKTPVEPPGE